MPDTRCRIPDAGYQMPDTRYRIQDAGYSLPAGRQGYRIN